ncbi:amino acid ABC transporter permease [Labrenzia sp. DG1229]|uniref:amino acid ABC transporter permease n=1 Tax=Labrenzia sp. DG1229 TaxID=681847 RepID=UPI00048EDE7D|nr:amino acid ABC transporter permease [Labrenzia sp. DG1229]
MSFFAILLGIFEGFRVTFSIVVVGLCYAVPFAFCFGILQYFSKGPLYVAVTAIIEFWRSSPVVILLFVFYYSLPAFGITMSAFTVGSLVLGLNTGGYASQAVRAALQSLDRGQYEAGVALGLPRFQILWSIELPQAVVSMVPTFINLWIQLIKGTALVSLITMVDMTARAKEIAQIEYNPVGIYSGLLLAYLIICYPVTIFGRWVEGRNSQEKRA